VHILPVDELLNPIAGESFDMGRQPAIEPFWISVFDGQF